MGRGLGGWLVVGAFVFVLAKCGEIKTTAPVLQPTQPVAAVSHDIPAQPAPLPPASSAASASARSLFSEPTTNRYLATPEATQRAIKRSLYVTGKEVPLRAAPDGKAKILDRLPTGMEVGELARREGWVQVRHPISAAEGWMSTRRLTTKRPTLDDDDEEQNGSRVVLAVAALSGGFLIVESRGAGMELDVAPNGETRADVRPAREVPTAVAEPAQHGSMLRPFANSSGTRQSVRP